MIERTNREPMGPQSAFAARTNGRSGLSDRGAQPLGLAHRTRQPKKAGRGTLPMGRDEPGVYVRHVRAAVAAPPPGSSQTAHEQLFVKYGHVFDELVGLGPGATRLGNHAGDRWDANSFDIVMYPEESLNDTGDWTYHKYGVLTYFGQVDPARGITKHFMIKDVLWHRYSYPGEKMVPVMANFIGKSLVFAVAPWHADHVREPQYYTFPVGVIEQMIVPDGVLNITTHDHDVYPGTIRRTVLERNGGLFLFTSGAGENNYNNSGENTRDNPWLEYGNGHGAPFDLWPGLHLAWAKGNDRYGAHAFATLDYMAFQFVQSRRNSAGK
jgi:hypothetical protein